MAPTLTVRDLVTELATENGSVPIVDGVSFSVDAGATLAIVGESGCGKSMTALSILRILEEPVVRIASGDILLEGEDLLAASEEKMCSIRSKEISIIFQDPAASLNPIHTVGNQIIEVIRTHEPVSYAEARERTLALLRRVRIPDAEKRIDDYPHRLSGGMCQRIMIAMAIACQPKVLIADEPTTALDTTVQAQVMALLKLAQKETGTAVILITHNLAAAAEVSDHVAVMYAGRFVEEGPVEAIFNNPLHPYTQGLLGAIPHAADNEDDSEIPRLVEIKGTVPPPGSLREGCAFEPRCPRAQPRCRTASPELLKVSGEQAVACLVVQEEVH